MKYLKKSIYLFKISQNSIVVTKRIALWPAVEAVAPVQRKFPNKPKKKLPITDTYLS